MQFDAVKPDDNKVTPVEFRVAQADSPTFDAFGKPPMIASAASLDVTNIGQVSDMKLPAGFVTGQQDNGGGFGQSSSFNEFHSGADPDVKVFLEYRGHRMSQPASDSFHNLLSQPPHNLKPAEINDLKEVLQDKGQSSDFLITTAKTQDVHGKRVLVVEGDYTKYALRARTMYVDSDNTGSAVQQITFQAPTDRYNKNVAQGTRALESITWK